MLRTRIIPALLLRNESLVKTVRFNRYSYIGDPLNTCRIFNELEVDELMLLDITASLEKRGPNFKILSEIATECFMPLAYGGGIRDIDTAKRIFGTGFEKIILNTYALEKKSIVTELAGEFGSQSVIISIDAKKSFFGKYNVHSFSGEKKHNKDPVKWAKRAEEFGAGEILLTSINREGTWEGYDIDLVKSVANEVSIPVIANGGAGSIEHIEQVVKAGMASAVALGSMVVFQGKGLGVLVNFPDKVRLEKALG